MKLNSRFQEGASKVAPLVILVHGRAGNKDVMWTFKRYLPEGAWVLAVEAPIIDPIGGFSWWIIEDASGNRIIPERSEIINSIDIFCSDIEEFRKINQLTGPVYGIGFSQGGGLLSIVAQDARNQFEKIGLLASFIYQKTEFGEPFQQLYCKNFFIGHGTQDQVVTLQYAQTGEQFLKENGANVVTVIDEVGHKVGSGAMRSLRDWLLK